MRRADFTRTRLTSSGPGRGAALAEAYWLEAEVCKILNHHVVEAIGGDGVGQVQAAGIERGRGLNIRRVRQIAEAAVRSVQDGQADIVCAIAIGDDGDDPSVGIPGR